jgi:hypothetical protein
MQPAFAPREYRPTLISRRGELIAWVSFLLVGATWMIMILYGQRSCLAVPVLGIILLLAALSISLGNWMDRNTVLCIKKDSVSYRNGLRNVEIRWDDIQEVQVLPAQWGKKVHVIADQAHFHFQMLGEVKVLGEVKGRVGFSEGDLILEEIIERSKLHEIHPPEQDQSDIGVYYARD